MFLEKRKEVDAFKKERMKYQHMKAVLKNEQDMENQERKDLIRQQHI